MYGIKEGSFDIENRKTTNVIPTTFENDVFDCFISKLKSSM